MCPLLPFWADLLPQPVAPLKLVPCDECQGEQPCDRCGGSAEVEVCSECNEIPEIVCGVEACSCTFPLAAVTICEVCEQPAETEEGLCRSCFRKGIEKVLEEEDPQLAHYYYLRDFDLPADVLESEMAWAKSEGVSWL